MAHLSPTVSESFKIHTVRNWGWVFQKVLYLWSILILNFMASASSNTSSNLFCWFFWRFLRVEMACRINTADENINPSSTSSALQGKCAGRTSTSSFPQSVQYQSIAFQQQNSFTVRAAFWGVWPVWVCLYPMDDSLGKKGYCKL